MFDPMISLVLVGLFSIACQFLAYKIRLPAILPLLVVGILVGPVFNILDADTLFGDLLFPVVSLSVAIILFEGSLTLKFSDIAGHGKMVRNLCSVGCMTTWTVATLAAHYFTDLSFPVSFLFGAIVTVTGPTVIAPMLRTVRPNQKISNILRWEGIIIDPIGALLAVLVYEFVISSQDAVSHTLYAFGLTLSVGVAFGIGTGIALGSALKKNWIPLYLENTAVLTIVLAAFAISNAIAHESGLLTVTLIGLALANMKDVKVDDILEFKETLSVLLISGLFILLATRLDLNPILELGWGVIYVVLAIMFVARPLSVALSSIGTSLTIQELGLISWIAPRGIVAAAVSALFSLKLEASGYPEAAVLVPMVFMVIIITVVVQSLTSGTVAKLLDVNAPPATGYLLFGGGKFSQLLALEMNNLGIDTLIADTNWDTIKDARMNNIPVYFGNPISEHASRHLDMSTIGQVLILSPYRQMNPLVYLHFSDSLGAEKVWGLFDKKQSSRPSHQLSEDYQGSYSLFSEGTTYGYLSSMVIKGATIKTTPLSDSFTYEDYKAQYGEQALPLLIIDKNNKAKVCLSDSHNEVNNESKVVSLILPDKVKTHP
ncbi:sodium:proton antiporter [Alteromonas sp. 5E99-2]|uniref:cation:proton antiporter n=1 Tax=Alteromonas sp. 5E99-2 TaxID=2817683 RepID=UPI001A99367F|nr:sodium:proton antiporter [Alteromonas sp. 5E99-2]MBO1254700.1 sodium:proton antiporter [Alteromonas sp. 5E99-2]